MKEKHKLLLIILIFLGFYFIPFKNIKVQTSLLESFLMTQEYAREHVFFCLIPAFFIAGAISVFISQASVTKYFGPKANKLLSYSIASVSGTILAVCSCTILPLFAGIYKRGAGIGPATTFLYSGPAINVLAIILTARVLGLEIGLARAIGAILFSVIIGLTMSLIFRKEKIQNNTNDSMFEQQVEESRPLQKTALYFLVMVLILIFATWGKPTEPVGLWNFVYQIHWHITAALFLILICILRFWFQKEELKTWVDSTWSFAKQIFPLLLSGVMIAGLLMGRPGYDNGLIPNKYITTLVSGNSVGSNFFASVSGALMYFATLTEIPILQGLMGSGMGKGPALALLLSGPALSLPSMLVLNSIMGTKKTVAYVLLVVIMSTITGLIYGTWF